MNVVRRVAVAAVGAGWLGLAGLAWPAQAADEINIDFVQAEGDQGTAVVAIDSLPADSVLDETTVGVKVDGEPVNASVRQVTAGDVERTTVLVLDASNSMGKAGKLEAAVTAVRTYLDTVPADVAVGLVTFAADSEVRVAPTDDRAALLEALEATPLARGTQVYDALAAGIELAGTDGARSVLLLSDGGDTGSLIGPEQATADAVDADVIVDVVALGNEANAQRLAPIAEDTGGSVVPADPAGLATVFADQADALGRQLLVSFELPEGVRGDADVEVVVTGTAAGEVSDAALMAVQRDVTPAVNVVDSGRALVDTPGMLMGAAALFVGFVGVLWLALGNAGRSGSRSERRLDDYFAGTGPSAQTSAAKKRSAEMANLRTSAVAATDKVVTKDLEARISQRLMGAGSPMTASEWILLHVGIVVGAVVVGAVLGGGPMAFLGLVLGAVVPWFVLKFRHSRRLNAFNAQLPETLGLMAGGLQAGLSLPQAVDTVVSEGHEPMSGELRRALVEQRLGIDMTDALEAVGKRMESEDFSWIVMAIRIQREVGGNLAEILHTVSDTLREREYLRRQVKALSAEGRLSGYILTALPPLIFFYMTFANPDYARVLYTSLPGYIMLAVAGMLLGIGSFAMSKLATVEV